MPSPTLNRFECIGRLSKDPELKYTAKSHEYVNGSIAINSGYFNKASKQFVNETTWVNFTAWRAMAKRLSEKCAKGDLVYIAGNLKNNTWTDGNGNKRNDLQVNLNEVQVISSSNGGSGDPTSFDVESFGSSSEDSETPWDKALNEA